MFTDRIEYSNNSEYLNNLEYFSNLEYPTDTALSLEYLFIILFKSNAKYIMNNVPSLNQNY